MSIATATKMISPAPEQAETLALVSSFLDAHEARRGSVPQPAFYLSGAAEHDKVELTESLFNLLKDVVHALNHGQSVSIIARDREISTQQAAEILGISRPTVVELIKRGELEATVPGASRRKLRLADVLAYQESLHQRRNDFIAESAAEFGDIDPGEISSLLEEARRAH